MKNFVVGMYVDYEEYNVLACFNSVDEAINYIKKNAKNSEDEKSYEIYVICKDNVLGRFSVIDVEKYAIEYNLANFLVNTFNKFLDATPAYKINKEEYETYMRCKEVIRIYNILYQEDNT